MDVFPFSVSSYPPTNGVDLLAPKAKGNRAIINGKKSVGRELRRT